jgi:tetratricopeptide (TPR) repeat protein
LLVAWGLGLGTACAYQRAMHKGEHLAGTGDWEGAYGAYSAAADKKPEDPEAKQGRDQARDHLVDAALTAARAALDAQNFEEAAAQIDKIEELDPDRPEVFQLRGDCERAMAGAIANLWEAGDARGSYAMAVRAKKLFPKASYLQATFDQLHQHFTTRAEALLREKKFDYALVAIRTISEFEPDKSGAVAPVEHRILSAWADDCAAKGDGYAKAKKTGAAAAMYARAYEVGGRPEDLTRAQTLAKSLVPYGKFSVLLTLTGAADRSAAVRAAIDAALEKVPDAGLVTTGGVLAAKLVIGPPKCTEVDHPSKGAKDYVSGQVSKPNPAHAQVLADLGRAKADLQTATSAGAKLAPDLASAKAAVAGFDTKIADLERKHAEAESQATLADQQLDAAKKHRDDLDGQIEQAKASGTPTTSLETDLAQADKNVAEWAKTATARRDAEDAIRASLDALNAQRQPAVETRDRLDASASSLATDKANAEKLVTELAAKLAATPATVMEDVHQTFTYDIHDWTRTCTAPVSVTMAPKWKTALPTSKTFAPANQVSDRSHVGFVKAAVEADPKAYPSSDAELVARGDADTATAVGAWLSALADDWYRSRLGETAAAMRDTPVDAATSVVALYLGAKDRLDPDTLAAFQSHLTAQFGLQKPELLAGPPSP